MISVKQLYQLIENPRIEQPHAIIDIRIGAEFIVKGSKQLTSQSVIEQAAELKKEYNKVFLLCETGEKSQQLAELLGEPFQSMIGGFAAWSVADMPIVKSNDQQNGWLNRFQQQIKLPGFGEQGQKKLAKAHVTVVGAGGLGAPALLYLVSAGIGKVTLIDDDQVALSNLHRQIIYDERDVGLLKTQQAEKKLQQQNSGCEIKSFAKRISTNNVDKLLNKSDMVIDGTDNFKTRYVINDYCLKNNIPWVFAGVNGFELQVAVLGLRHQHVCFRCLFPEQRDTQPNGCLEQGVLGTVTGLAAMLQVTEVVKILADLPMNLTRQMIHYNVLTHRFKMLKYPPDLQCPHR